MSLPRLVVAVPTPVDANFRVQIDLLAAHCTRCFAEGSNAIVLFGTTGEGTFFSASEKISALVALISAGVDPSRIILATGTCSLDETATMIRAASAASCLGSLVLPPFYTKAVSDDGLVDWFVHLAERSGTVAPLFLYHIPAVAGVGFSGDLVRRLFERHPAVRGVKDSTADSALAKQLLGMGLPGVYVSTEVGLGANLRGGMAGTISASLNISLPQVRNALNDPSPTQETVIARLRAHLSEHNLIWAVKTALAHSRSDPTWKRLTPPHRPPIGISEKRFLGTLESLLAGATA